jgi:signal transduction histidine kinase
MMKKIDRQAILQNKEVIGSLIGILPDATLILNNKLEIVSYNERALQALCKNKSSKINSCLADLLKALEIDLEKLISDPIVIQKETFLLNRSLNFTLYPVKDSQGIVKSFVLFLRDITLHKALEASDYEKTIQLNKLFDAAKQLTSSLDVMDVLTRIANEACALLKTYISIYLLEDDGHTLKPKVVVDPVYADEIMNNTLDIDNSLTGKAIKAKKSMLFNDVHNEEDAYQIPGTSELTNERVLVSPFIIDDKVLGAMCLNRIGPVFTEAEFSLAQTLSAYVSTALKNSRMFDDLQKEVEERKKVESNLNSQREQLELINKILRHDITNNLVAVRSALRLYKHSDNDSSFLESARVKIDSSLELIKKMRKLEFLIKSHEGLKVYEIRDVVDAVCRDFPDLQFQINGFGMILADEAIYSVLKNIISNSLLHGKAEKIEIDIDNSGKFCQIRISDNGKGIPDKFKKKVFEENFKYGDNGQTGQGLYIVKKAVEKYGGYVFLEDNIPEGTSVTLSLQKAF